MAITKTRKKTHNASNTLKQKSQVKPDSTATKDYAYKVESGIVISGARYSSFNMKFPFELMKPGDSFLIPPNDPSCKNPNTLHYAAKAYARMKPGFTITSRLQLDKSRRVWRLK